MQRRQNKINNSASGAVIRGSDDFSFIGAGAQVDDDAHRFLPPKRDNDNDPFLNSLDNLTPDDIAPKPAKPKKTVSEIINSSVRTILLLFCIGVFVVSAGSILNTLYNYRKGDDIYNALADDFYALDAMFSEDGAVAHSPASSKSPETPDFDNAAQLYESGSSAGNAVETPAYNVEFEKIKAKLNYLAAKNSDLYGWIKIDNTTIDYPVVQGTDNDYYLNHDYNGEFLTAGAIFVDYRCNTSVMKNHNTIIYGHNMTNGKMFNNVTKYLDEKFFNDNPYVTLSTPDGIYTYLVFAIYETDMYNNYITASFATHEDFVTFAEEMQERSIYTREGVTFDTSDRVLTLSTCTNGFYTQRYCLQAKLVEVSN